jgi:hypothetical protein
MDIISLARAIYETESIVKSANNNNVDLNKINIINSELKLIQEINEIIRDQSKI